MEYENGTSKWPSRERVSSVFQGVFGSEDWAAGRADWIRGELTDASSDCRSSSFGELVRAIEDDTLGIYLTWDNRTRRATGAG
jgi:hypothetical protein